MRSPGCSETCAGASDDVQILASQWITTPLGPMLGIAGDDGVVLFDFADRRGLETAIVRMCWRFGTKGKPAVIVPGENLCLAQLKREIDEYFSGKRQEFSVPLSLRGTDFEQLPWQYLRLIEFGQSAISRPVARWATPVRFARLGATA